MLASGSDHGCCSLILWDTRSWTITSRIQSHIAAVTAIVDLEDGRHLLTGSYDKKINLFNHVKGQIILSLNNNRSSVTGMVMTIDKYRLVCSCLDSSLTVWTIIRKNNVFLDQYRLWRKFKAKGRFQLDLWFVKFNLHCFVHKLWCALLAMVSIF